MKNELRIKDKVQQLEQEYSIDWESLSKLGSHQGEKTKEAGQGQTSRELVWFITSEQQRDYKKTAEIIKEVMSKGFEIELNRGKLAYKIIIQSREDREVWERLMGEGVPIIVGGVSKLIESRFWCVVGGIGDWSLIYSYLGRAHIVWQRESRLQRGKEVINSSHHWANKVLGVNTFPEVISRSKEGIKERLLYLISNWYDSSKKVSNHEKQLRDIIETAIRRDQEK